MMEVARTDYAISQDVLTFLQNHPFLDIKDKVLASL